MQTQKETPTLITRRSILRAAGGGGAALAAAVLARGLTPSAAQAQNQPSLAGAWDCRDGAIGRPFLTIYFAEGTFVLIPSNVSRSFAMSAWALKGDRQFTVTDRRYRSDDEGKLVQATKVTAVITLDESGDSLRAAPWSCNTTRRETISVPPGALPGDAHCS